MKETIINEHKLPKLLFILTIFLWSFSATGCQDVQFKTEHPDNQIAKPENKEVKPGEYPLRLVFTDLSNGWLLYKKSLWKTTDGGVSWKIQLALPKNSNLASDEDFVGLFFLSKTQGWLFTNVGLLKTTDGGESWARKLEFDFRKLIAGVYFNHSDQGWIVGSEIDNSTEKPLLLYTTDGGSTWSKDEHFSSDQKKKQYDGGLHSIYFIDKETGWISGNGKIWVTNESGKTWEEGSMEIQNEDNFRLIKIQFLDSMTGYAHGVPNRGAIPNILVKTTNGGRSWQRIASPIKASSLGVNDFHFLNDVLGFAIFQGFLFETVDGGKKWVPIDLKDNTIIQQVFFLDKEHGWLAGKVGIVFSTDNAGKTWIKHHID